LDQNGRRTDGVQQPSSSWHFDEFRFHNKYTGDGKIMETIDNIEIELFVLVALKKHYL
jgi:hypothetical protein